VRDLGPHGASLDVPDPDGTVLRFLANNPIGAGVFVGVDSDREGRYDPYISRRFIF
jgi:hypothetical protein